MRKCLFGHRWEYYNSDIEHYSFFGTDWFSKYELNEDTISVISKCGGYRKMMKSSCRMCKRCHQKEIQMKSNNTITYKSGQYWMKTDLSKEDKRNITLNKLGI